MSSRPSLSALVVSPRSTLAHFSQRTVLVFVGLAGRPAEGVAGKRER